MSKCFNPPPPFQAREQYLNSDRNFFNPVSIHPRLFRRGNLIPDAQGSTHVSFNPPPPFQAREPWETGCMTPQSRFQSTPAFSGEGTVNWEGPDQTSWFQSTPAFSGEGTIAKDVDVIRSLVSIHPRLFRRGNSSN